MVTAERGGRSALHIHHTSDTVVALSYLRTQLSPFPHSATVEWRVEHDYKTYTTVHWANHSVTVLQLGLQCVCKYCVVHTVLAPCLARALSATGPARLKGLSHTLSLSLSTAAGRCTSLVCRPTAKSHVIGFFLALLSLGLQLRRDRRRDRRRCPIFSRITTLAVPVRHHLPVGIFCQGTYDWLLSFVSLHIVATYPGSDGSFPPSCRIFRPPAPSLTLL